MFLKKRKRSQIITGLDIGTTKVCTIIGKVDDEGSLAILGMGSCPSKGLQRGEIIDIQATVDAIVRATNQAMEVAGVPVGDIYVGIAGEHIQSVDSKGAVVIDHPRRGIDEKDLKKVVDKANSYPVPEEQAIIHVIIQEYRVNGQTRIRKPVGLSGTDLEVRAHLVLSKIDPINNILKCMDLAGFRQPRIVLQSLASSMSVANAQELELGTILIDIGGGTTDVAIFYEGALRATFEIGLAGDQITRDIAIMLGCSLNDAENAKKRLGSAVPQMVEKDRTFSLPHAGNINEVETHEESYLATIIEARLEEIFEVVRHYIDKNNYRDNLHAGAILTGGTALLPGITDLAQRVLDMRCRTGSPQALKGFAPVVSSPIYSTGVGLILYGIHGEQPDVAVRPGPLRRALDYIIETFVL